MNNNFLEFILNDIEAKKTLISTMPTRTKTNIKKYNEKIDEIIKKYEVYKSAVRKYIDAKDRSFHVKEEVRNIDEIEKNIVNLEDARNMLNPLNTPSEKIRFDTLSYELKNYYEFKFSSLNDIIEEFLKKCESVGILFDINDFNYTPYVNQYMEKYFKFRNNQHDDYDELNKIFEQIYWNNPDIILQFELNFRQIVMKNFNKLNSYITKQQKELLIKNKVKDYDECISKLKEEYQKKDELNLKTLFDIIELAKKGSIEITNYFKDSKIRTELYSSLSIEPLDFDDDIQMNRFYDDVSKLKGSLIEYRSYLMFLPIFDDFKKNYKDNKSLPKDLYKELDRIINDISKKEKDLFNLNKKIISGKFGLFERKTEEKIRISKIESIRKAKELSVLYNNYEKKYIEVNIINFVNTTTTVSEIANLYYSYDYLKKTVIKRVFNINNYADLTKKCEEFDCFAKNPNHSILDGILIYDDSDLPRIIANRYRLNNINISENELKSVDDIDILLNKIDMLLRIKTIENSSTSIEKIWFMVQVNKIHQKD